MKASILKFFFWLLLLGGSIFGMPMTPEQMEKLLEHTRRPKLVSVKNRKKRKE